MFKSGGRDAYGRLFRHPENPTGLFPDFGCEVFYPAEFHARGHAMFDTCRFKAFLCQMGTENTDLGGKREIGEKRSTIGKLLLDLKYLDAMDAGLMGIFLSASQLATMAARAKFVIN
jgi:hypothetical protein